MKLIEKKKIVTSTYKVPHKDFMVDIVVDGNMFNAWLYHKDYGIKEYMFGSNTNTPDEFMELVIANLPHYIELFYIR